MNQIENIPTVSAKTLLIATLTALLISFLAYITVILPAEYNVDPTGIGKKLGLMVLSETKIEIEAVTPPLTNQNISDKNPAMDTLESREDMVSVTIPAKKGIEYKFKLKQFGNLTYEWKTNDGSNIYFDFHGEPAGDTTGYFESFTIATTNQMQGSATVPFDGSHGWYWKNTSNQDVMIELKTSGNYQVIGLK